MDDFLNIGDKQIKNRFFLGTGKFASNSCLREIIETCGINVVTVALRRVDIDNPDTNIMEFVPKNCIVMANTSGARNAEEAVRIARLARSAGNTEWIKLEVIQDNKYLLPDNIETLKAVEILANEGFTVLPYMSPDIACAKRMISAGAKAVMPLGSPIGSNRGLKTEELVKIMINEIKAPVIVDAGLGNPSDAAHCMELGCAGVLVNTAVAISNEPVLMARAFNKAVSAGRMAFLAGTNEPFNAARASSPLTGFLTGNNK
ncbi:thiazole-phosphate synthase [Candidatus Omnitrophus magneticus]|uniref:Thiazole synthase n=1 Tax=Candidatus Omnitrophus magneticus TaxID=1609969 RepID=A0A0F0CJ95_9BACT|nr:thiazole-phosphate synthase [Candidatus Omnitrophus magneticus]